MELIVILLGELLFAPFIAALILVLELVALAIGGVLDLIGSRVTSPDMEPQPPARMPRRWSKILLVSAAGLALGTFGTLLALDLFCFAGTTRWVLDRVEKATGIQIAYDSASGSLFGGRLSLDGVAIKKSDGPRTRCDLTVKNAEVQFSIWTLLDSTIRIDSLELRELHGSFTRLESNAMPQGRRGRKAFRIQKLAIEDLDVEVNDRTKGDKDKDCDKTYRVNAPTWRSEPLRSRWLPFDILFHTNCVGTLADADFEIRGHPVEAGRETRWKATNLPAWYLARELSGPFGLIQEGMVDIEVDDLWRHDEVTGIDSHWRLVFHGVRAEVPEDLPLKERLWHKAWVSALNKLGGGVPLEFRLTFDGSRLTTHASPGARAAWEEVGGALVKRLLGIKVK